MLIGNIAQHSTLAITCCWRIYSYNEIHRSNMMRKKSAKEQERRWTISVRRRRSERRRNQSRKKRYNMNIVLGDRYHCWRTEFNNIINNENMDGWDALFLCFSILLSSGDVRIYMVCNICSAAHSHYYYHCSIDATHYISFHFHHGEMKNIVSKIGEMKIMLRKKF